LILKSAVLETPSVQALCQAMQLQHGFFGSGRK
jgi:hypothetical protein